MIISWARTRGIEGINIDLVYGLPHQTVDSFERTLATTLEIAPDRIALFNYAHVPWLKKHQALIRTEDLPGPESKIEILERAVTRLVTLTVAVDKVDILDIDETHQ